MTDNPELFGGEAATGNVSYPAKSPRVREAEERRAQSAHAGAYSIPEVGPKIKRGTNVEHPALKPARVTPS